jgi:hypothetical protein
MLNKTVIALLSVGLVLSIGCSKKDAQKNEGAKTATAPAAAPAPEAAPADKAATDKAAADKAAADKVAADKAAADKAAVKPVEKKPEDKAAKARREIEERRKRIQEIYALGRSTEAADATKLKGIFMGDGPVYERASAIRALGRDKRDDMIDDLKKLVDDKATAVRIESAINLYRWGQHKFALPKLKELRSKGVALRRAFQTGYEKGRPTYDKNAKGFFKEGIKNDNVYVRLDSAVGLIEVGNEKLGLPVVQKVIKQSEKYHIRMAAVNYMTPLKKNAKVREILEMATTDKDERVAKRARDVLGIAAPAAADKAAAPAKDKAATKAIAPAPAPAKK